MAADKGDKPAQNVDGKDGVKEEDKPIKALTEEDIRVMQAYGAGPYSAKIKALEVEVKELSKKVNDIAGIKESDTGLAHPSRWDLVSDKQMMQEEAPLQVSFR
jgi:26S proteasome regulatory subunit T1